MSNVTVCVGDWHTESGKTRRGEVIQQNLENSTMSSGKIFTRRFVGTLLLIGGARYVLYVLSRGSYHVRVFVCLCVCLCVYVYVCVYVCLCVYVLRKMFHMPKEV